jgi:hypothetical protein
MFKKRIAHKGKLRKLNIHREKKTLEGGSLKRKKKRKEFDKKIEYYSQKKAESILL